MARFSSATLSGLATHPGLLANMPAITVGSSQIPRRKICEKSMSYLLLLKVKPEYRFHHAAARPDHARLCPNDLIVNRRLRTFIDCSLPYILIFGGIGGDEIFRNEKWEGRRPVEAMGSDSSHYRSVVVDSILAIGASEYIIPITGYMILGVEQTLVLIELVRSRRVDALDAATFHFSPNSASPLFCQLQLTLQQCNTPAYTGRSLFRHSLECISDSPSSFTVRVIEASSHSFSTLCLAFGTSKQLLTSPRCPRFL